jgi:hypothetical protein
VSPISIKGILAGNGFNLIASVVVSTAAIFMMTRGATGALPLEQQRVVIATSSYARFGAPFVGAGILIASGYIAAALAAKAELLNGALATLLSVVSGIVSLATLSDVVIEEVMTRTAIGVVVAPFLGMLGGYLCRQRVRRVRS